MLLFTLNTCYPLIETILNSTKPSFLFFLLGIIIMLFHFLVLLLFFNSLFIFLLEREWPIKHAFESFVISFLSLLLFQHLNDFNILIVLLQLFLILSYLLRPLIKGFSKFLLDVLQLSLDLFIVLVKVFVHWVILIWESPASFIGRSGPIFVRIVFALIKLTLHGLRSCSIISTIIMLLFMFFPVFNRCLDSLLQ